MALSWDRKRSVDPALACTSPPARWGTSKAETGERRAKHGQFWSPILLTTLKVPENESACLFDLDRW